MIFACRSKEKAHAAVNKIHQEKENVCCDFLEIDFCSLESVKAAAVKFKIKYK